MARGGVRPNAGRPSKADEQKLIEHLRPMASEARTQLKKAIKAGEQWAVKLFFEYYYGKPKQTMDVTTGGDKITDVRIIEPND